MATLVEQLETRLLLSSAPHPAHRPVPGPAAQHVSPYQHPRKPHKPQNAHQRPAGNFAPSFAPAAVGGAFGAQLSSAPGVPSLSPTSDSGVSSTDRVTNFDNSSPAKALQFNVPGTLVGATVMLYADGNAVGSVVAADSLATIVTNGTATLTDGVHSFTARQTVPGDTQSGDSPAVSVTIDTVAPPAPLPPDLEAASDSGLSSTDNVTNVNQPVFDVTAGEAGAVHLSYSNAAGSFSASAPAGGAGTVAVPWSATPAAFGPSYDIGVYAPASTVTAVDVNGDGNIDVLAGGAVLLGRGDGSFQPARTSYGGISVATGDFNKDGKLDLAVGNTGTISILLGNGDGTFGPPQDTSVSGAVMGLAVADVTGDGNTDVVAASYGGGMILVAGSGDGTFQATRYLTTTPTRSVVVTDFNGDGKPDLAGVIVTSEHVTTPAVYLGNGDGTFGPAITNPALSALIIVSPAIAAGDFNGDGRQDLVVTTSLAGTSGNAVAVRLLLGNSDGVLSLAQSTVAANPNSLTVADVNRDGKPDLVTADSFPDSATVSYGNGDGTFRPSVVVPMGYSPVGVAVADFNRDGRNDLVVANTSSTDSVSVSLGSDGPLPIGAYNVTAWAEDVAGNASPQSAPVPVIIDTAGPTVAPPAPPPVTAPAATNYRFTVTFTDNIALDASSFGDGNVLVTGPGGFSQSATLVAVDAPGNGTPRGAMYQITPPGGSWDSSDNGTYTVSLSASPTSQVRDTAGNAAPAVTIGTVPVGIATAPGALDLLATTDSGASSSDNLTNFDNSSAGRALQFSVAGTVAGATVTLYADGVAVGSAVASGPVGTFTTTTVTTNGALALSDGAHVFTARQTQGGSPETPDSPPLTVTIDTVAPPAPPPPDLEPASDGGFSNTDNLTNVNQPVFDATAAEAGAVHIRYSGADSASLPVGAAGTVAVPWPSIAPGFGPEQTVAFPFGSYPSAVAVADVNLDGNPDVLTAIQDLRTVSVLLGNGDGTFQAARTLSGSSYPTAIGVGDFNKDGKPDVVAAGSDANGSAIVSLFPGGGDGTFGPEQKVTAGVASPRNLVVTDLNGDGRSDLVVAGDGLAVLVGNGNGAFQSPRLLSGSGSNAVAVADFNGDRKPDLAAFDQGTYTATPLIYLGNGDGTFRPPLSDPTAAFGNSIQAGDFNGDGKQDFIATTFSNVTLLLGKGDGTFQAADFIPVDKGPDSLAVADVNHDGKLDFVVSLQSLDYGAAVRYGNGDGTFQPNLLVPMGPVASGVAVADFNRDSRNDLLVSYALNGSAGVSVSLGIGGPLPDGTYNVKAWAEDLAGNASPLSAPLPVTVDTAAPTAGALSAPRVSAVGGTTYSFTVTFADNTAVDAASLGSGNVLVAGPGPANFSHLATLVSVSAAGNGAPRTATYQITPPGGSWDLGDNGTYTVALQGSQVRDTAGNFAPAATLGTFLVGNVPTPGAPDLLAATDSGSSATDNLTSFDNSSVARALQFSVPGTIAGATVTLYADGNPIGTASASGTTTTVTTNGTAALSNGAHAFTASQAVSGGPSGGQSPPLSVLIDTAVPTASAPVAPAVIPGGTTYTFTVTFSDDVAVDASSLGDGNVVVTGPNSLSQPATLISVSQAGDGTPRTAAYQITPAGGSWDVTDNGAYTVALQPSQVRDTAGNAAPAATLGTFVAAAASPPGAPDLLAATDSGNSVTDNITNFDNGTPSKALQFSIAGTLAGSTVTLFADGIAVASAAATGATTTISTDGTAAFSNGAHAFTARRTQPGGTDTADSPALLVTIDTVAPPAPPTADLEAASDSGSSNTDNLTRVTAPVFDVTTSEAGAVHLQADGIPLSSATVNAGGSLPVTSPASTQSGFGSADNTAVGSGPSAITTADVNGDGRADLLTANAGDHTVSVLLGNGDGTFRPAGPIAVSGTAGPSRLAVADFNGDGKPDLLAGRGTGLSPSLFLGNGDGTFSAETPVMGLTGAYVTTGDFNRDGKADVVASDTAGPLGVALGNGDGTFRSPASVSATTPAGVYVGDFNADGKPDLAFAVGGGTTVGVALGRGDGTFSATVYTSTGGDPRLIAGGDFNNDGKTDLAVTSNGSSAVLILIGSGDGRFVQITGVPVGGQPKGLMVGDFNRDGYTDIATTSSSGQLKVALGTGFGRFLAPQSYGSGLSPSDLAAADFNGDGRLDLALADSSGNAVPTFLGTGGPTLGNGTHAITAWTEDTAGNQSLMSPALPVTIDAVNPRTSSPIGTPVAAAGATTYQFTVTFTDDRAVDVGSLDNGDILVTGPNKFSQPATFVSVNPAGNGTPRTATYQITPPGGTWDLGDNGTYTLIEQSSQVLDTAGNPAGFGSIGTFTVALVAPPGMPDLMPSTDSGVSSADNITNFNNRSSLTALQFSVPGIDPNASVKLYCDGKLIGGSVITASGPAYFTDGKTTLSDGVHSITARQTLAGGPESADSPPLTVTIDTVAPPAPPAPDLEATSDSGSSNSDNVTNVNRPVIDVTASEPGTLRLNYSPGTGASLQVATVGAVAVPFPLLAPGFGPEQTYPAGATPVAVAVADMNLDGKPDVLTANSTRPGFSVLLGNGDGTFQSARNVFVLDGPRAIAVGDFNEDGRPDVVTANLSGSASIFPGLGDGSFAGRTFLSDSSFTAMTDVAVGDVNLDGNPDVVVAQENVGLVVFLGSGTGAFEAASVVAPPGPGSVAVADLNGDGKPDLVGVTGAAGHAITYLGNGDGTFGAGISDSTVTASTALKVADFNGDGKQDLVLVTDSAGTLGVLAGNGDGTFQAPLAIAVTNNPHSLTAADVNHDGKLDLVCAGSAPDDVNLRYGNGDGTFQANQVVPVGHPIGGLALGDFNLDGSSDLVLSSTPSAGDGNNVAVLLGGWTGVLPDGTYNVTATLEDLAGNVSAPSAPLPVTIDTAPPVSSVAALPASSPAQFTVSWSGSEPATGSGSGVASYTVYVSDNGGPFTPWLTDTALTQSAYAGTPGHTYSFYSLATDYAGNTEAPPAQPDATTVAQAVSGFTVGDGTTQRSLVNKLTLVFASPATPGTGAFTLERLTTDAAGSILGSTDVSVGMSWSNPTGDGTTWVISFTPGSGPADAFGGLSDGVYRLTMHAALTLDALGSPVAGGDQSFTFHRLFGDADGNGTVNALDYARFRQAFGSAAGSANYNSAFDSDANGSVNALDYAQFKKRFGTTFTY